MLVVDTIVEYHCAKCRAGKIEGDKFAKSLRYFKTRERDMICVICKEPMHLSKAMFKILKPEDIFPLGATVNGLS